MMLAALRKRVLGVVAGVLSRWLEAVTAQIDAAPERRSPPEADAPADIPGGETRLPTPPEHWVELVRQHAPQLLDEDAPGDTGVFEYRADEAFEPTTARAPALQVKTRNPKAQPVHVVTPAPVQAAPIPTVRTKPKRTMRLANVRTQAVHAETVAERGSQTNAEAVDVPITPTAARDGAEANVRRRSELPAERQIASNTPELPDAPETERRFADLPVERRVREVWSSAGDETDVPSVRTSAGNGVNINQRRTNVPGMPPQTVFRPTTVTPRVNFEAVTAERWASLPDMPHDEEPRNLSNDVARRARLKREQEGRSWSE